MAAPKINKEDIVNALKYIDKNGVPFHNQSTKYELVSYPDFISRNNEPRIIADVKYKPSNNIGGHDYLQMLAYMFRFDAKTGYYLYPEAEGTDDMKLRLNRGSTYEANVAPRDDVIIVKHGLKVPADASDYGEFVMKMKMSEQKFTSIFWREQLEVKLGYL